MILGILRLFCSLSFASQELATVLVQVLENVRGSGHLASALTLALSAVGGKYYHHRSMHNERSVSPPAPQSPS